MSALIIGGDKIKTIVEGLKNRGFEDIEHVSGRKAGDKVKNCITKVDRYNVVIVLTDYINHCVVTNLKNKVDNKNVIFCRRSWPIIEKEISKFC